MGAPPRTAAAEAPLPRCSTTRDNCSSGRPRNRAVSPATCAWLIPCAPYRRMPRRSATSRSTAYVAAAAGSPAKNAVSKTATCRTSGNAARVARIPARAGGLCKGANATSSPIPRSTSSSTNVGSV